MQDLPSAEELGELVPSTWEVEPTQITGDVDLLADFGADSLALANLLAVLEKRLQPRLPPKRFADVETVDDLQPSCETGDSAPARES